MTDKKRTIEKLVFIGIILMLCCSAAVYALDPKKQISQYGYSVWSRQRGLPANSVNVVIQSRDGYLWFGTTAGLLRFDGVRFEAIGTDTADSKNREVITALCETRDGSLWIGTSFAGIRHLKDGKLLPCGPREGFPAMAIRSLFESRTGRLWIGTSDGLFEYSDGQYLSIPIDPPYILSITEDSTGIIFIGTGNGVRCFDEARPNLVHEVINKEGLPGNLMNSDYARQLIRIICKDHQGNIWIGTDNELVRWINGKIIIERMSAIPGPTHITALCEDRHGNLWVGTTQGVFRIAEGRWTNFRASDGLLGDNINWIFEDREGSIWVCTLEGICRFSDVNMTTYTTQEGLANNYQTSVLESSDGSMIFLSAADGGSISKLKNGTFTSVTHAPPIGPSFKARDGSIWTSQSGSLCQIKNDRIIRYDTTTGLPWRWISAITEDSISLIVYLDRIGIQRFINGRLNPYLMADGRPYSKSDFTSCLYHDLAGTLWLGTSEGLVNIQNGKSTSFNKSDGMADSWISVIIEDHQGSLWIGSPRGGLTHYHNGKFTAYTTRMGLFTNEIYSILVDDAGDVWLSSPRGIGRIHRQQVEEFDAGKINHIASQVFTTADGMRTDECFAGWQPAAWKAHDGRLWFATTKGTVMIDPKTFKRNDVPPPVYIEQFIADLQSIRLDRHETLPPGCEKLEFHYTALSYLVPERVFFKYILEGFDREWVDAGTRRVAYYTNLPPGHYTFRVIACNNDGVWNESGSGVAFELAPHFYQTFWFLGLVILLIAGTGYVIYWLRVLQLLKREKELEQRIHERTRQLEVANQELEAFSYSVSHDLRAPLRSIDGFSVALLEDYLDKLDDQGKDFLRRVRAASQHMEHLIDDIINLSRVMRSAMQRTEVDLSTLAQSIANELRSVQPERNVTFIIAPDLTVQADRNLMVVALENLLENAWKFTSKHPAGKIEVGALMREGQKVFFVRDDGDGFDMAFAGKLFGAFQRMHSIADFKGTGIGLATVRRIIHRHGGQVWAEAEKEKGATFYFTIH
ncbi:MAG: hypothetical protein EHM64_02470 [Ignavibacteriae bacterium]|nr:MAG: hypothetical protein EHM64_02470 [Ignavibacteriota bacterium]